MKPKLVIVKAVMSWKGELEFEWVETIKRCRLIERGFVIADVPQCELLDWEGGLSNEDRDIADSLLGLKKSVTELFKELKELLK